MLIPGRHTREVDLVGLGEVPIPSMTDTYTPIPYRLSTEMVRGQAEDTLRGYGYKVFEEKYIVTQTGSRMFGQIIFRGGDTETHLAIGFMNSYDKSVQFKIATGARVLVCTNLQISGTVVSMRKHTREAMADLEFVVRDAIIEGRATHITTEGQNDRMKQIQVPDETAYRMIFETLADGTIKPSMVVPTYYNWQAPQHQEFVPRNAWSLYNAFTEAMKVTPGRSILDAYHNLHSKFVEEVVS